MALLGIVVAISGGILISTGDAFQAGNSASNPLLGNLLALAGAFCIGPHFLIGRRLRQKLSLLSYITLVNTAAAIVLLGVVAVTGSSLTGFESQGYLWIVLLALLPQLVGHTSLNWSLGVLPATYATIPVLGEPIGATFLAILIFGEILTPFKVGGAFLTLSGIALMMWSRLTSSRVNA
jgi:drug/metabolite transporter (DMT)-like permease